MTRTLSQHSVALKLCTQKTMSSMPLGATSVILQHMWASSMSGRIMCGGTLFAVSIISKSLMYYSYFKEPTSYYSVNLNIHVLQSTTLRTKVNPGLVKH
jgi:hypothetical protein